MSASCRKTGLIPFGRDRGRTGEGPLARNELKVNSNQAYGGSRVSVEGSADPALVRAIVRLAPRIGYAMKFRMCGRVLQ